MMNTDVFEDFDMVVSMTQKTINKELTHLTDRRILVINPELVIQAVWNTDREEDDYTILASKSDLPTKDDDSVDETQVDSYLAGLMQPQILIQHSGTVVTLLLNFDKHGTFGYYAGSGPHATWKVVPTDGWVFGISVNMGFAELKKEHLQTKIKVPDIVNQQLTQFMDNHFTVNHLFMDFENSDLINFDPTITSVGDADDKVKKQFVFFMQEYLKQQIEQGNPYVLGYTMSATDKASYASYDGVPDSLRPVGTTFTFYKNESNPDYSTLNFLLVTRGGHQLISSAHSTFTFDTPWISKDDSCDAKMIYSRAVLLEEHIVKPFFEQLQDSCYNALHEHFDIERGTDFGEAKEKYYDPLWPEEMQIAYRNAYSYKVNDTSRKRISKGSYEIYIDYANYSM